MQSKERDSEAGKGVVYIDSRVQRPVSAGRRAQARGRRARRAARPGPTPHRLRTPPRQPGRRPTRYNLNHVNDTSEGTKQQFAISVIDFVTAFQ